MSYAPLSALQACLHTLFIFTDQWHCTPLLHMESHLQICKDIRVFSHTEKPLEQGMWAQRPAPGPPPSRHICSTEETPSACSAEETPTDLFSPASMACSCSGLSCSYHARMYQSKCGSRLMLEAQAAASFQLSPSRCPAPRPRPSMAAPPHQLRPQSP